MTVTSETTYSLDNLPQSIWLPKFATSPECYHGSPLEILEGLAHQMGPSVGIDDAITQLIDDMEEQGIQIQLPSPAEAPCAKRAALLILVLLLTGYAREVPQA